jgi:hypothetical protein
MSYALQNRIDANEPKNPPKQYRLSKWYVKGKIADKGWCDFVAYAVSFRQLCTLLDATGVVKHVSEEPGWGQVKEPGWGQGAGLGTGQ